jgi:divalent metal cation (Fe/Co/Zn/Cd) transporter
VLEPSPTDPLAALVIFEHIVMREESLVRTRRNAARLREQAAEADATAARAEQSIGDLRDALAKLTGDRLWRPTLVEKTP